MANKAAVQEKKIFINDNLKFIRSCYQMTQQEMSDKVGINLKAYQKYEEGRATPKLEQIIEISCKLNFTLEQLVKTNLEETFSFNDILLLSVKPKTISEGGKKPTKTQ